MNLINKQSIKFKTIESQQFFHKLYYKKILYSYNILLSFNHPIHHPSIFPRDTSSVLQK